MNRRFFIKKYLLTSSVAIAVIAIVIIASYLINVDFVKIIRDFPSGFGWFLTKFTPIAKSFQSMDRIVLALGSTVLSAIAASVLAALVAYIFAIVGSKIIGFAGPTQFIIRGIASVIRNIPVVAWAFILLFAFKQSTFTGFLVLFLKSFGFLTRSYMELLDEISMSPIEALQAVGATRLQIITQAIIPLSMTSALSWALFRLESNIRDATLVGILTGTGIGFLFEVFYRSFRYDTAGLVVITAGIVVVICEASSNYLRRKLITGTVSQHGNSSVILSRSGRIKTNVTTAQNKLLRSIIVTLIVLTVLFFLQVDTGGVDLRVAFVNALKNFGIIVFEPGLGGHFQLITLIEGLFSTLSLAIITTFIGAIFALLLGACAASNLTNKAVSNIIKVTASIIRSVPTILWVLIFTVAIGLGAEACIVGMLFHTVAFLTKAYSETFENTDEGVIEALKSIGATWWQVIFRAVLPEKLNELLTWTFLDLESNFVNAVVVGAVAGAGGIGYQLFLTANFYFNMHEVGLITYLCLGVSLVFEIIATKLRRHFIVN
ncbi:MAG: ABC transporter permease subunit [Oscillospiraceae bacterium]|nr:ABC transporter permease subunit [Oscillospiraceae bacterium]